MNKCRIRRIESLEKINLNPRQLTDDAVLEAAIAVRAGGDVPIEWASFLTPDHLCDVADLIEFDRAHPVPKFRLPCSSDPGFDWRNPNAHMQYTEEEDQAMRDWGKACDEFNQRQRQRPPRQ